MARGKRSSKTINNQNSGDDFERFIYPIEKFKIDDETLKKAEIVISYFRQFPHVFAKEYLGIKLYDFQIVALHQMMHRQNIICIECRNLGKTFLTAVYMCTRCILYPKTKVIIVAPEKSQSAETITKIKEIMMTSPQLRAEISDISDSINNTHAIFHNGSTIRTVTMSEGSRSKRANLVVIDEYVWTDKDIIDNVITNFLGDPRKPEYLKNPKYFGKPEYEFLKEPDTEIYLSSAGHKSSWAYQRFEDYAKKMIKGDKDFFVCDIPYQTAVKQGLRSYDFYAKQMRKEGFDKQKGDAEYCGIWMTDAEGAFFRYETLDNCRNLKKAIYPNELMEFVKSKNKKYVDSSKPEGSIRICGADLSFVKGRKNDASSYGIMQLTPKEKTVKTVVNGEEKTERIAYYDRELIYIETHEGMLIEAQANRLKKLFFEFNCDYMVVDTMNAGVGIVQELGKPSVDIETGCDYPPMMCKNKDEYAEMCNYPTALKKLYCMNASGESNKIMAEGLQKSIGNKTLKLLINEGVAKDQLRILKDYDEMPSATRVALESPYLQTRLLINEMAALELKSENPFKLKEPAGGRKDRYSMLLYLSGLADELEKDLQKPKKKKSSFSMRYSAPDYFA